MSTLSVTSSPPTPGRSTTASAARGELTKATSLRATWWCAATALAAMAGLPLLLMTQSGPSSPGDLAVGSGLALMIVMAMAAVLSTSDLAHGTLQVARWAHPRRWSGYLAKVVTVGLLGGLVGLVGGGLTLALAVGTGNAEVGTATLQATLGQAPVFALASALASGVGLLVRRTGLAVAGVIIWIQVVESLAPALPHVGEHIRAWLPFMNAFMFTMPGNFADPPHAPLVALAYFAAVVVAVLGLAGAATTRRDL